jgi:hypothetical protein
MAIDTNYAENNFLQVWKDALDEKGFKLKILFSALLLAAALITLTNFLNFVEARQGVALNDPILNCVKPINLTWFIFLLIYSGLLVGTFELSHNPKRLIIALQAYAAVIFTRIVAMRLLPFEAPGGMIPLADPFVQFFGPAKLLTKDLFFSGHTATLFLLFLAVKNKFIKIYLLISAVLVAVSVLLQHVHYSIDVFAAPFFTYCCYRIISDINKEQSN